jgi:hypothetical protein
MRRNSFDKLLGTVGIVLGVFLLALGGLTLWGSTYIHNQVTNQLSAQKIYFPPAAAFAHPKAGTEITPSMIPSVSQYAGQQMLTGQQAESYANNFIAVHLQEIGGGKTYSQLSTEAMALSPTSKQYAAVEGQVQTVFRGDTLRSMLLNAFSWWKVSQIAFIVSLVSFGLGAIALLGGFLGFAWSGLASEAQKKVFQPTDHETIKVA